MHHHQWKKRILHRKLSCTENCKFCAQAACHHTATTAAPLVSSQDLLAAAKYNESKGIPRFSVVTAGRQLPQSQIDRLCEDYQAIKKACNLSLCISHGLLDYHQFCQLKAAGIDRCHNNLETSRRFFPFICTTHTYQDKIDTIHAAQAAGLHVCSGGIMGLGETMEDRIDLAMTLRHLGIKSVPINILNPIPGTPLAQEPRLSDETILRITAIFRFILPDAAIRLAGGRGLLGDHGKNLFATTINGAITGDMLTTSGISLPPPPPHR